METGSLIIYFLAFLACTQNLNALPVPNDDFSHVVEISVNDLLLFNLIKDIHANFTEENIRTIFHRILSKNNITIEDFNFDLSAISLGSKLRRLWKMWTTRNSGSHHQKMLSKWQYSKYELKVYHKTGSPTKRKLEMEVESERAKWKKLEDRFNAVSEELSCSKLVNQELLRKVERLSNGKECGHGKRGRTKNKETYSSWQRRRHHMQKTKAVKDFIKNVWGPKVK